MMLRYCLAGRHIVHDGTFCELCPGPLSFDGRRCMAAKCKSLSGKHAVTCSRCGSGELAGYAPSVRLGAAVITTAWALAALILWAIAGPAKAVAAHLAQWAAPRLSAMLCPVLCATYRLAAEVLALYALSFLLGETGRKLRASVAWAARALWGLGVALSAIVARAAVSVGRIVVRLVLSR